ncbi:amino acid permease [Penicillium chermesinum]|uniref:Amino acid permease n=1 Tax=Penicillium chermesinum TaxID=63820 RepID=A0A9W9NTX6_9EURO|nr:amino acid permease [Penicillium chermesinum]KAJ5226064.1 amino acid permease [Penicillium chermesinum]KAJ6160744.1 amino acid permease [Penicillium chermesinum]
MGESDAKYSEGQDPVDAEKGMAEGDIVTAHQDDGLHRNLQARHLSMIALGGALGSGLLISTGTALAKGGPAAILIAYCFIGLIVATVLFAMGEVATWRPISSGFPGYGAAYVDPALGFALGYCYWFKYLMNVPSQLVGCALVLQYWVPKEHVNPGVWIAIFLVVIVTINLFGVRFFGELEFWMSAVKVLIVLGIIILCIVLAAGGGPNHDATGFRYWNDPGAFNHLITTGTTGEFYASISVLVTATYAFLGTELICVTFGEAADPRRTIPRAIRLTFFRIAVFYVLAVFLLGMLVPYNSPVLKAANSKSQSASASPFVVAIQIAGVKVLPGIVNACILIFVFSAANSDLYVGSRTIYGLAVEGLAPKFLAKTSKAGVPVNGTLLCALIACIGFLSVDESSSDVFTYLTNLVTIFGMIAWWSLLLVHVFFVRARRAQGVPDSELRFTSPFGIWGSYIGLFVVTILMLIKNFTVFVHSDVVGGDYGDFDYPNFITGYLGIPLFAIFFTGFKIARKTSLRNPYTVDLFTGKQAVDDEEREWIERRAAEEEAQGNKWHWYKLVGWLF